MKHTINLSDLSPTTYVQTLAISTKDKKSLVMETTIFEDGETSVFFIVESLWKTSHTVLTSAIEDYNKR